MKRTVFLCLLICGCSRHPAPIASPSGAFTAVAEITPGSTLIRLKVTETRTDRVLTIQTQASDVQKWALAWSPSGSLVLWSSDIGPYAYDIDDGQYSERKATADEIEVARGAYREKYGKEPPRPQPPK